MKYVKHVTKTISLIRQTFQKNVSKTLDSGMDIKNINKIHIVAIISLMKPVPSFTMKV